MRLVLYIIYSAALCDTFTITGPLSQKQTLNRNFRQAQSSFIQNHVLDDRNDKVEMQNTVTDTQYSGHASTFPISLVVGHDLIKQALLLAAIDPTIGVLISGGHGTCKSVLARALHRLLPTTIERIKNCPYNLDPPTKTDNDDRTVVNLHHNESDRMLPDEMNPIETEFVPTPLVQIPLNVMEDSLVGTIDLEQSLMRGEPVFSPGLLARAHRGILYIDDINLLDESIMTILFNVISEGYVHVEREGLSVKYPCRPILIATFNPEEGEVKQHLVDRIAVNLSTDYCKLTTEDRVRVVCNVLNFSGDRVDRVVDGKKIYANDELRKSIIEETQLQHSVLLGRQLVDNIVISHDQLCYLCEEASRAGCEGQRAEIFACRIAKANAALHNRSKVNVEDLRLAVELAVFPRSRFIQAAELLEPNVELDTMEQLQKSPGTETAPTSPAQEPEENVNAAENEIDKKDNGQDDSANKTELPAEFFFGVNAMPLDPDLMKFAKSRTKKGKGGKSAVLYNLQRGRFVKAIIPKDSNIKSCQLAVAATIRAAAPYQKLRRHYRDKLKSTRSSSLIIDKADFRIKRLSKKAGTLVIFVVDASGSMALNRMDSAKGSAISLLSEAYKSRDKICLIAFHGKQAEIIVPITKSIALTKRRLEQLPCGGGSPLAHALSTATRMGLNSIKVKKDVGRVVIVLVTDGRANTPLCVSMGESFEPSTDIASTGGMPSKSYLKDEVLALARKIGSIKDFDMLVIDTEDKFVGTGMAKALATVAFANYYHIEATNLATVSSITRDTVESFR